STCASLRALFSLLIFSACCFRHAIEQLALTGVSEDSAPQCLQLRWRRGFMGKSISARLNFIGFGPFFYAFESHRRPHYGHTVVDGSRIEPSAEPHLTLCDTSWPAHKSSRASGSYAPAEYV